MNRDIREELVTEDRPVTGSIQSVTRKRWARWCLMFTSERGLMGWAALEAGVPMLPVEFLLIPLTRQRPSAAMYLAAQATVFSAIGAIYSYALGSSGESILHWNGLNTALPWVDYLIYALDRWGEGLVLFAAFLPAPLSIVSMGAGFLHLGLIPFLLTVIIARGLRFYLVILLTVHFNTGKKNVHTER